MTDKLPPNLLALFAPRPPLRWVEAPDYPAEKRQSSAVSGLGAYLSALRTYKESDTLPPTESWLEERDRKKAEKKAEAEELVEDGPKHFKPEEDSNIRGDPFKTLIVARLSYEANQHDLEQEFGRFGPIERIRLIVDTRAHEKPRKKKKPHRGYAFVVFEREKDMRAALECCDNMRIKDRRIKVDVMRAKTVKGWMPRRLGGGLGGRGYTKAAPPRPGMGAGFNGGFRGGYRGFDGPRRGGGFRGGFGGRGGGGGFGGPPRGGDRANGNGFGAPSNAPSGPGGGRGGFGGGGREGGRSFDDRRDGGGRDGGRWGDRDRDDRRSGANLEPPRRDRERDRDGGRDGGRDGRDGRDGGRDGGRDRDGGYRGGDYRSRDDRRDDDRSRMDDRKRAYDGSGYDSERKIRRY